MEKKLGPFTADSHDAAHDHAHDHTHGDSISRELMCHLPYAVFSVSLCLIMLSIMGFFTREATNMRLLARSYDVLFHSFHYMHIIFAATGTLITFFRFSRSVVKGLIVGGCSAIFFCTLSDSVLPYLGGTMLGVSMHWHLCFFYEIYNVIPFLAVGLINGFVMSRHHSSRQSFYSFSSHFIHILISALASSFYLVGHGYHTWYTQIGLVFLFLVFAVVVPCTFSDVIVPMYFARRGGAGEHAQH